MTDFSFSCEDTSFLLDELVASSNDNGINRTTSGGIDFEDFDFDFDPDVDMMDKEVIPGVRIYDNASTVSYSPSPAQQDDGVEEVYDFEPLRVVPSVPDNVGSSFQFHAGESTTPPVDHDEARRRRAIRREILRSQRKTAPLLVACDSTTTSEVSDIAQLLLDSNAVAVPPPVVKTPEPAVEVSPPPVPVAETRRAKQVVSPVASAPVAKPTKRKTKQATAIPEDIPEHLADLPSGTDPESRRQRRLIRNRLSAALHRKRKRETIDSQQQAIEKRDDEIAQLKAQLQEVSSQRNLLRSQMDAIVRRVGQAQVDAMVQGVTSEAPPHLVNLSGSDNSDDEESDGSTMASPPHSPTFPIRQKKKRGGVLPAMATMAMCAVLGCVMLPPSLFQALDPDGSGLQTANVIMSSEMASEARRRLDESVSPEEMSAMAKWSTSVLLKEEPKKSFKISPLEMKPHLWRIAAGSSPWVAERSVTLFDLRQGQPMTPSPRITSLPQTIKDRSALARTPNLRGFPSTTVTLSQFQKEAREDRLDESSQSNGLDNATKFGNFMFCPAAYASLSAEFLHLTGLTKEASSPEDTEEDWTWSDASPTPVAKSDVFVDFDDEDDDGNYEETVDKALVPSYTTAHALEIQRPAVPLIKNVFTNSNDPYMSILVPARTLSHDLNFLGSDSGNEPWVELGCHVLSAKLIEGVQFVGDESYTPLH